MLPRRKQGFTKESEKGTRKQDESEKVLRGTNVGLCETEHVEDSKKGFSSAKTPEHGSVHGKRRRKTGFFLGDPNIPNNFSSVDTLKNNNCTNAECCTVCFLSTCICKNRRTSVISNNCTASTEEVVDVSDAREESALALESSCFRNTFPSYRGVNTSVSTAFPLYCQSEFGTWEKSSANDVDSNSMSQTISESTNQSLVGCGPIMTTFPWQLSKEKARHLAGNSKSKSTDDENFKNAKSGLSMLSSVYGIPMKSNIEAVLCGLKFSAINEDNGNNLKISDCTNTSASDLNKHSNYIPSKELYSACEVESVTACVSKNDVPSDANDSKSKFPNIKNPHILEQHISKIISENAAIVETLDPLWTRKSSKLMSSGIPSIQQHRQGETKSTTELVKGRRFGEDSSAVSVQTFKSKLHSALLGKSEEVNSLGESKSVLIRATTIKNSPSSTALESTTGFGSCDSIPHGRVNSNRTLEEPTRGSVVKSLLCLKQSSSFTETEKYSDKHPENPEGSIIKDLLLKTRSSSIQNADENKSFKLVTLNGDLDTKSRSPSKCAMPVVYICVLCDIGFRSKENLDIHQKHYCKGNKRNEEFTSHILKNQLLGFVGSTSPPLKKRKISEPVMPANRTKILVSSKAVDDLVTRNKIPQLCAIDRNPSVSSNANVPTLNGPQEDGSKFRTLTSNYLEEVILCTGAVHPDSGGKLLSYHESKVSRTDPIPSVVETIAKPILNSGGTVVHSSQSSTIYDKVIVGFEDAIVQDRNNFNGVSGLVCPTLNLRLSKDTPTSKNSTTIGVNSAPFYSSILNDPCTQKWKETISSVSGTSSHCFSVGTIMPSVIFPSNETKQTDCFNTSNVPVVEITPSLSPVPAETKCDAETPNPSKKLLAPARPTTLALNNKAGTLIGSTLVSPETPRPKKSRVQMYLNGQAYTYLGMKCSTRPTYCCIYRPQPMYVPQETDPKLSMYSNWQVVPADKELLGLSPRRYFSLYNSCQRQCKKAYATCAGKSFENLVVTHSSYWSFRIKEEEQKEAQVLAEKMRADLQLDTESNSSVESPSDVDSATTSMEKDNSGQPNAENVEKKESHSAAGNEIGTTEAEPQKVDESQSQVEIEEDGKDEDQNENEVAAHPPPKRVKIFQGGFKSNEDYTYIRGRGRGKYVCEECGIRCKKPSMLKKHIRTHTDLRPFKCKHCAFAFKTKGNLTKHMKSKAHHKKCLELGIVPVPTTIDDSQIDGIALSKQFSDAEDDDDDDMDEDCDSDDGEEEDYEYYESRDDEEEYMSEYEGNSGDSRQFEDESINPQLQHSVLQEKEAAQSLLDLSSLNRPTKWPVITPNNETDLMVEDELDVVSCIPEVNLCLEDTNESNISEQALIGIPQVLWSTEQLSPKTRPRSFSTNVPPARERELRVISYAGTPLPSIPETSSFNKEQAMRRYSMSSVSETRKMVLGGHGLGGMYPAQSLSHMEREEATSSPWISRGNVEQPMDLRVSRVTKEKMAFLKLPSRLLQWGCKDDVLPPVVYPINEPMTTTAVDSPMMPSPSEVIRSPQMLSVIQTEDDAVSINSGILTNGGEEDLRTSEYLLTDMSENPASPEISEYNSQLSPISPASPEDEGQHFFREDFPPNRQLANDSHSILQKINADLASKRCLLSSDLRRLNHRPEMDEGKCTCSICHKTFSKPSQLRLHVNIHYFERPFRCDSCAVSFRTKGHLQKHKRSVSHYNKVNMNITFGTPTTDNPRPFKCADCKIAFRIHGHLAKHLRSKMHIMKLECLGKLPFGMYAEMERSGINLNEIDTTDCENSLESLQTMAQRLYNLDPRRMRWQSKEKDHSTEPEKTDNQFSNHQQSNVIVPQQESVTETLPTTRLVGVVASPANAAQHSSQLASKKQDVKQEVGDFAAVEGGHGLVTNFMDVVVASNPRAEEFVSVNKRTAQDAEPEIPLLHRSCTCHLCGRLFKSAKFLQVHLYYDHQGWTEPVCNKSAELPRSPEEILNWNQEQEQSGVTDVDSFSCEICRKHFASCTSLQQHMLAHAQLRPFVCDVCDAGFTTSVLLAAHVVTHQQEKSLMCHECGNTFAAATDFQRHIKAHLNDAS